MTTRSITLAATLALITAASAACGHDVTVPEQAHAAAAFTSMPVTLDWQEQARNLVAANRINTLAAGRIYAALGVAQYKAVQAADAELPVDVALAGAGFDAGGRSRFEARRGAVAGASAQVLGFFFPAAVNTIEQKLSEHGHATPGDVHPQFMRGVATGRSAGDALIEHVKTDGFTTPWTGTVPTGEGVWVPSALPPGGGTLGGVKPYFMTSGAQFRPAAPPVFNSAAFNADLAEVITMSVDRTPAQLELAKYWDSPPGTPTPIGVWNSIASTLVASAGLDERAAAHVFGMLHATMFDALIGCWEAKYHYWMLRPSQANASVSLAFGVPNFPAYPSGHSCISSAAGSVLGHFFPAQSGTLAGLVNEAGESRVYAGIHYRFDVTAGSQLGRAVASWSLAKGLD